jgi:hypothetical protein
MKETRLFKVRVEKPDGRRAVYYLMARTSAEAAARKRIMGRIISAVAV